MPPGGVGPGLPVAEGVNGLSHAKHAFVWRGRGGGARGKSGTMTTTQQIFQGGREREEGQINCGVSTLLRCFFTGAAPGVVGLVMHAKLAADRGEPSVAIPKKKIAFFWRGQA